MCTNPVYCEGDCQQCDLPQSYISSLIMSDGKPIFRPQRPYQRVVNREETDRLSKFMEEQLKKVSYMGRKFYKGR